jgi:hypothetical protein
MGSSESGSWLSAHDRAASGQTRGSTNVNSPVLERPPFRQRLGGRLLQPSAAVDGCGSSPFVQKDSDAMQSLYGESFTMSLSSVAEIVGH